MSTISTRNHVRRSLATDDQGRDSIDRQLDDDPIDSHDVQAPSRRSDKEIGKLLNLLDGLQTGEDAP